MCRQPREEDVTLPGAWRALGQTGLECKEKSKRKGRQLLKGGAERGGRAALTGWLWMVGKSAGLRMVSAIDGERGSLLHWMSKHSLALTPLGAITHRPWLLCLPSDKSKASEGLASEAVISERGRQEQGNLGFEKCSQGRYLGFQAGLL